MNVTGLINDNNNNTFFGVEQYDDSEEPWLDKSTADYMWYVVLALGIPGNILSAIVWLRRHVASENPSAIYLAALAVNDLIFLITFGGLLVCKHAYHVFCPYLFYPIVFAVCLEPLIVLGFSVVRFIAIRRPLQVCCMHGCKNVQKKIKNVKKRKKTLQN